MCDRARGWRAAKSLSTRCRFQVSDLRRMGRNTTCSALFLIAIGKVESEIFLILAAGNGKQHLCCVRAIHRGSVTCVRFVFQSGEALKSTVLYGNH